MKKGLILLLVLVFVVTAAVAFAGISTTRHNLTSTSTTDGAKATATAQGETLCGFCHIPHGGNTTVANAPLWSRSLRLTAANPYTVYGGGTTLGGTAVNQPGTNSLTCLSCHDGTIAVGQIIKYGVAKTYDMVDATGTNYLDATDKLIVVAGQSYQPNVAGAAGNDLSNDHPVGLIYNPAKAGLDALATVQGRGYKFYGAGTNQMECASCHDPHISTTSAFKRSIAGGVDFCVGCHFNK